MYMNTAKIQTSPRSLVRVFTDAHAIVCHMWFSHSPANLQLGSCVIFGAVVGTAKGTLPGYLRTT